MAEREPKAGKSGAENPSPPASPSSARAGSAVAPDVAPNMLIYADISRMLFRMHRNVSAHMDAHKRLAERMQSVFSHEQAMVLELARLIDQSMSLAQRQSNEGKPPLGGDSVERIFDHARNAMQETGRMMTEIQLESLALLQHYVTGTADDAQPESPKTASPKTASPKTASAKTASTKPNANKGTDKK